MALFKVSAAVRETAPRSSSSPEIFRAKNRRRWRRPARITIEITGSADKIEAFERMVRPARAGRNGPDRGDRDRPVVHEMSPF